MTTYWQRNQPAMIERNGNVNHAVPSNSFWRNNTNPSITYQAPNSPAPYSRAETLLDSYNDSDGDDLQSQGACALSLKHSAKISTNYEEGSSCDIADEDQYFHVVKKTEKRILIEEIESTPDEIILDDSKEDDDQRTQRNSSNDRNHNNARSTAMVATRSKPQ